MLVPRPLLSQRTPLPTLATLGHFCSSFSAGGISNLVPSQPGAVGRGCFQQFCVSRKRSEAAEGGWGVTMREVCSWVAWPNESTLPPLEFS